MKLLRSLKNKKGILNRLVAELNNYEYLLADGSILEYRHKSN